jgi:hypothetical protein
MSTPYFFGYGSLVNLATHSYGDPHLAQLKGWRRTWAHTDLRDVAFLTVTPCPGSEISGILAAVPNADWAALAEREFAYERVGATENTRVLGVAASAQASAQAVLEAPPPTSVYAVPEASWSAPDTRHPVLLSYLDVVVQGYFQQFGESGVEAFFATTDGWDAPVLDDRAAPRYPRHQQLSVAERALVDRFLSQYGASVLQS